MPSIRHSLRNATGIAALTLALPAAAQTAELPPLPELPPMGDSAIETTTTTTVRSRRMGPEMRPAMSQAQINALPEEYRSLPLGEEVSTTTVDENGVETITRTRRIASRAPAGASTYANAGPTTLRR